MLDWARRILADTESLEQEASELREGLVGRLRIGAIPVTLPAMALLTDPFAERHPKVTITVLSHTSIDIQRGLDDFSLDAGLTYLDNEPLSARADAAAIPRAVLSLHPRGRPLWPPDYGLLGRDRPDVSSAC